MENEKVCKYRENLEELLKNLKEERQGILEKVANGESLTMKENKRNKKLAEQIKGIESKLVNFNDLDEFDLMNEDLSIIGNENTEVSIKAEKKAELLELFKEMAKNSEKDFLTENGLTEEDLKNLDKIKEDTKKELEDLKIELRLAKRRNYNTEDIEKDIENANKLIKSIDEHNSIGKSLVKIEEDLNKLASKDTNKNDKTKIMTNYNNLINEAREELLDELNVTIEDEIIEEVEELEDDKKSLKERTKEKLNTVGDFFSKNRKKIITIGSTAVLCVAIVLVAKSCSKDIENSKNNDDLNNKTSIEQVYDNVDKKIIKALKNKGYNEYNAMLMAENFDDTTLETLQEIPYIETVENYVTDKEFNLDYLNDYENARNTYNLTSDKAVDYVNRSVKIQETGFYDEASINEIVGVVKAVDDQITFKQDGDLFEQTIYASCVDIYNTYMFTNESQEEDINKIEAFKYFAKDGSELDLFLTEYTTLIQNVLKAKGNVEESDKAKQSVYNYLNVFASTFAGNTVDVKNQNENAIISDTYDWNVAYHTFIGSTISMFITEKNINDFTCLQTNMLSNFERWAQVNDYCIDSESLNMGGR